MLIQLAQGGSVINETEVTTSRCDRSAQMKLPDNLSTSGRSFRTKWYVSLEYQLIK